MISENLETKEDKMERDKIIVVSGVCSFCQQERPVFAERTEGDVLDSENYLMPEHRMPHHNYLCRGGNTPPEIIGVKIVRQIKK